MLRHFGFLCTTEFTVPNLASFSPVILLSVADIAIKTDPFRNGCHIHIGLGRAPLHGSAFAGLPLLARKYPWPLVPTWEWSTSFSLNPD